MFIQFKYILSLTEHVYSTLAKSHQFLSVMKNYHRDWSDSGRCAFFVAGKKKDLILRTGNRQAGFYMKWEEKTLKCLMCWLASSLVNWQQPDIIKFCKNGRVVLAVSHCWYVVQIISVDWCFFENLAPTFFFCSHVDFLQFPKVVLT